MLCLFRLRVDHAYSLRVHVDKNFLLEATIIRVIFSIAFSDYAELQLFIGQYLDRLRYYGSNMS